jgi:hypothetical protein
MASDLLALDTFTQWVRTEITEDESGIEQSIDAAETVLRFATGRAFQLVGVATVASSRAFRPASCSRHLWIDDAATITAVTENGVSLVADTDYLAEPYQNRDETTGDWRPFDRLLRFDRSWYTHDVRRTASITGTWGWSVLPAVASEALQVIAADWQSMRNSRNGVVSVSVEGFAIGMRENPLVQQAAHALRGPKSWGISVA